MAAEAISTHMIMMDICTYNGCLIPGQFYRYKICGMHQPIKFFFSFRCQLPNSFTWISTTTKIISIHFNWETNILMQSHQDSFQFFSSIYNIEYNVKYHSGIYLLNIDKYLSPFIHPWIFQIFSCSNRLPDVDVQQWWYSMIVIWWHSGHRGYSNGKSWSNQHLDLCGENRIVCHKVTIIKLKARKREIKCFSSHSKW